MADEKISELAPLVTPASTNEFAIADGTIVSKRMTLAQLQGGITEGSIPFVGQAEVLKQDSSNFFWDDINNRLGVGTNTPQGTIHVQTSAGLPFTSNPITDDFIVENAGDAGINVIGADGSLSQISLGSPSNSRGAFLSWIFDNDLLSLSTNKPSGELSFRINQSIEAMRINSLGNIGIGLPIPEGSLHISSGTSSTVNPTSQADDLIVQNSDDVGITLFSPDANVSSIVFGTPSGIGGEGARIRWSNTNNLLSIGTINAAADIIFAPGFLSESMRLRPDGKVGIGSDLPQARLHIKTGDAGAVGAPTGADELLVEGSANTGITIISPATSFSQLIFGSPAGLGGEGAKIRWKDSTALFEIETTESGADIVFKPGTASEAMRVRGSGVVIIGAQIPGGTSLLELVSTTKCLMLARWTAAQEISNTGSLGGGDKGLLWFNTTSNFLKMWNGTTIVAIA